MSTTFFSRYHHRISYQVILLGTIGLLASTALVIADLLTREEIALRQAEDFRATLEQVLPPEVHDNQPQDERHLLLLKDGSTLPIYRARLEGRVSGVAFQVRGRGYAGPIEILMGVDASGQLLGVRVLRHTETPGLGDKIEVARDPWVLTFNGLSLGKPPLSAWAVKKDGGQFDQFTGATITPRAVVQAVRDGLILFQNHQADMLQRAAEED